MSTQEASGPSSEAKDVARRKSLGKYVKRMSSVFKRERSEKSSAASTPAVPASPAPQPAEKESTSAAPAPATTPTPAAPAPAAAEDSKPAAAQVHTLNRSALQQERARALFAKYGLTLESHEWISTPSQTADVQRVEKPIRMRVHRECHHCGTIFGADKACAQCEHKRCKKCPRFPKKKAPGEKGKQQEEPRRKKVLTLTSRTGGELMYQPVKQRVRRSCHKCDALFIPPTSTVCGQCRHVRCTKCPREPAKLGKFPHGYPGDVQPESETEVENLELELENIRRIWRRPRTRVRWECEECHSLFQEASPLCPGCGHERCEKCTRKPLKKSKKDREFDPEIVRAVEAKLRALQVQDEPPASSVGAS